MARRVAGTLVPTVAGRAAGFSRAAMVRHVADFRPALATGPTGPTGFAGTMTAVGGVISAA
jgi:hypothetical protein